MAQAVQNLDAMSVALTSDQIVRLNAVSDSGSVFPTSFLRRPMTHQLIFGDTTVDPTRATALP